MAMQAFAALHHTLDRRLPVAPWGLGVALIAQVVPFHASARVSPSELPTAMQAFAALHDTPDRIPPVAPRELGVASIAQVVPFHASVSVLDTAELAW